MSDERSIYYEVCSPLHSIRHCSQTIPKPLSHSRKVMKRGLHAICRRPQFLRIHVASENMTKKVLWICQKPPPLWRTHFVKKFFVKRSRIWRIPLYTLFAFRTNFVRSFLFRHRLRVVCRGLMAVGNNSQPLALSHSCETSPYNHTSQK